MKINYLLQLSLYLIPEEVLIIQTVSYESAPKKPKKNICKESEYSCEALDKKNPRSCNHNCYKCASI